METWPRCIFHNVTVHALYQANAAASCLTAPQRAVKRPETDRACVHNTVHNVKCSSRLVFPVPIKSGVLTKSRLLSETPHWSGDAAM